MHSIANQTNIFGSQRDAFCKFWSKKNRVSSKNEIPKLWSKERSRRSLKRAACSRNFWMLLLRSDKRCSRQKFKRKIVRGENVKHLKIDWKSKKVIHFDCLSVGRQFDTFYRSLFTKWYSACKIFTRTSRSLREASRLHVVSISWRAGISRQGSFFCSKRRRFNKIWEWKAQSLNTESYWLLITVPHRWSSRIALILTLLGSNLELSNQDQNSKLLGQNQKGTEFILFSN